MKTSLTHPLQIDHVRPHSDMGLIGMCLCPGKKQPETEARSWDRDITLDIQTIRAWNAVAVLTLLEEQDMHDLEVSDLGTQISDAGMTWYHLPIKDYAPPTAHFEEQWQTVGKDLRLFLKAGDNILIHCNAGLGRSGTIAAKLLIELGLEAKDAVNKIRQARPGAIETTEQLNYVMGLK